MILSLRRKLIPGALKDKAWFRLLAADKALGRKDIIRQRAKAARHAFPSPHGYSRPWP